MANDVNLLGITKTVVIFLINILVIGVWGFFVNDGLDLNGTILQYTNLIDLLPIILVYVSTIIAINVLFVVAEKRLVGIRLLNKVYTCIMVIITLFLGFFAADIYITSYFPEYEYSIKRNQIFDQILEATNSPSYARFESLKNKGKYRALCNFSSDDANIVIYENSVSENDIAVEYMSKNLEEKYVFYCKKMGTYNDVFTNNEKLNKSLKNMEMRELVTRIKIANHENYKSIIYIEITDTKDKFIQVGDNGYIYMIDSKSNKYFPKIDINNSFDVNNSKINIIDKLAKILRKQIDSSEDKIYLDYKYINISLGDNYITTSATGESNLSLAFFKDNIKIHSEKITDSLKYTFDKNNKDIFKTKGTYKVYVQKNIDGKDRIFSNIVSFKVN